MHHLIAPITVVVILALVRGHRSRNTGPSAPKSPARQAPYRVPESFDAAAYGLPPRGSSTRPGSARPCPPG
ncbi:hypothetical protein Kpho02_29160 [Kitasatospora phosalacinea]|uniref:Uncharacterized protein n=1 Tax=Kitasatospora phosalacinea TaxID=2065 RepID=A0A9W6Q9P8_9ACTN|nr:hypothetical protein [Kitasatospora phosalacinea]GLW70617.1 hypothetical protein Kpho02_29160 [Kitasatospora phosalacinea]